MSRAFAATNGLLGVREASVDIDAFRPWGRRPQKGNGAYWLALGFCEHSGFPAPASGQFPTTFLSVVVPVNRTFLITRVNTMPELGRQG